MKKRGVSAPLIEIRENRRGAPPHPDVEIRLCRYLPGRCEPALWERTQRTSNPGSVPDRHKLMRRGRQALRQLDAGSPRVREIGDFQALGIGAGTDLLVELDP